MKKVQFFSDANTTALQYKINEWLSENCNASIIDSDLTYAEKDKYTFYILYMIPKRDNNEMVVEELKEVIEEGNPAIDTKIDPNIIKPN